MRAAVVMLAMLAGTAHADDRGFTWGAFAGPGYDSGTGYRTGFDLEIGQRIDNVEWAIAPRLMVIRSAYGNTNVYEAMALLRVFVVPRTYVEVAGGMAFMAGETGGDFIHLPDVQPAVSLGVGYNLVRSQRWLLDVRALYMLDVGFRVDSDKSTLHGILVGPALRFY